jgi:hypothetical protein
MQYVYFGCDWVIQTLKPSPLSIFRKLYDLGIERDCLFLTGAEKLLATEDGIHVLQFLWQAPSFETLKECWESIEADMQFSNCKPIPEQEFVGLGDPHAIARMRVGSDFNVHFDRMAAENDEILNRKQQ